MEPVLSSKIVDYLQIKCRLVETAFIEEMADHFTVSMEDKLKDSIPFEKALDSTVEEFGGIDMLQKMEWSYRRTFMKKQFGVWWVLVKEQFYGIKKYRALGIIGLVVFAVFFIRIVPENTQSEMGFSSYQVLTQSIFPIMVLVCFIIQRYRPGLNKWVGVIKSEHLYITFFSHLLFGIFMMLNQGIDFWLISQIHKEVAYALLWSSFFLLILPAIDYWIGIKSPFQDKKDNQMELN